MDESERRAVRAAAVDHAESVVAGVEERWPAVPQEEPLVVTPLPHQDTAFPENHEAFRDRFYPYAAGAAVRDDADRLLLIQSVHRDPWENPGGSGEAGETPAETARREVREETGLDVRLTRVLYVRTMELDLGAPERLPIPVVIFGAEPAEEAESMTSGSSDSSGPIELDPDAVETPEEVERIEWFAPDEIPDDLRDHDVLMRHL